MRGLAPGTGEWPRTPRAITASRPPKDGDPCRLVGMRQRVGGIGIDHRAQGALAIGDQPA